MASYPIYQFYSELKDYSPTIWRRFQVPGNISMARLGYILMAMFEMKASHRFCLTVPIRDNAKLTQSPTGNDFVFPDESWRFEISSDDFFLSEDKKVFEAPEHKMSSIIRGCQGEKLTLEYDFGDGWEVDVTLEAKLKDKELSGRDLPRVLAGEGYGIIEDCGGPGGLEHLAEAFRYKGGDDYERYREWLGQDDLDLSAFNLDDMNLRLKKLPRIFTEVYEYGNAPSQRSIDFLERKYLKD